MQYVGLLRGINVGGNNKVPMAELRQALETAGFREVRTYIASGNVLFRHPSGSIQEVQTLFEAVMSRDFGIATRVLVLPEDRFRVICSAVPPDWTNDKEQKSDILFLFPEEDSPETLERMGPKADIDQARYVPGAILWKVSRANQTRSALLAVVGTKLYKAMTIRNVNTLRKLQSMLETSQG